MDGGHLTAQSMSHNRAMAGVAGPAVLVVDGDDDSRRMLVEVLETGGIRSLSSTTAATALEIQREHRPAVAVVDFRLPDASGLELARAFKERDGDLPVILLTGYASIESVIASADQLDTYVIKPVSQQNFLQSVRNALARRNLVVENKGLQNRLQKLNTFQALYDPLTGLPNRALLEDRIAHSLAVCRRSGSILAVLFLDFDTFKVVNDLFGHHMGDELLKQMADRLSAACRASDTVARFGGDEFVIVCPDVKSSAVASRIAEHLIEEISAPFVVGGIEHRLTASIGIAMSARGASEESTEMLLRNADTAMYRSKESGGGSWELFDETMRDRIAERFEVEQGLRASAHGEGLALVYQPIVSLQTGRFVGAEAFLRWHRPGHGAMLPGSFLAIAEESGLILPIGAWVLEKAIADLSEARADGRLPESFLLAVNVSSQQLSHPGFPELVARLLHARQLPPSMLEIEVLEDSLGDPRAAQKVVAALRDNGIAVSLDHFAAGSSSLALLEDVPISGVKIDKRFIAALDEQGRQKGLAMVEGLLSFGRAVGLSVVAQGVETSAQAEVLTQLGCDLAQGYHFARPAPAEETWDLIRGTALNAQAMSGEVNDRLSAEHYRRGEELRRG